MSRQYFKLFCCYCIIYCNCNISHLSKILKICINKEIWELTVNIIILALIILSAHKNCDKSALHLNLEEILMSKEAMNLPRSSLQTCQLIQEEKKSYNNKF